MAQPDPATLPRTARIAGPPMITGDPDAVNIGLQEQARRYTSPICIICLDGLCGFDTDSGEERIVVTWNVCGHTFHKACIARTLNTAKLRGLSRLYGTCPTCNGRSVYRPLTSKEPYTRIYLSTQDEADTEVVPLTLTLPDGTSANTNIITLAQAAKLDLETIKAMLQDLTPLRPHGPESPRLIGSFQSVAHAQDAIQGVVWLFRQRWTSRAVEESAKALQDGVSQLLGVVLKYTTTCGDIDLATGSAQLARSRLHQVLKEETKAISMRNQAEKETTNAILIRDQVRKDTADLVNSDRFRELLLDKEFSLRAKVQAEVRAEVLADFETRYNVDRQEMRNVVAAQQIHYDQEMAVQQGQHERQITAQQGQHEQMMIAQQSQHEQQIAAQRSCYEYEIMRLRQEIERLNGNRAQ